MATATMTTITAATVMIMTMIEFRGRTCAMTYKFKLIPGALAFAVALAWAPASEARVTRIVVDTTTTIANPGDATQPYLELTGRAWGELSPHDHRNHEITDLREAAKAAGGKGAPYIASWRIRMPANASFNSGVMWHDVPNRGGNVA